MSDYIAEIQAVFLKLHGVDAEYVETVPVVEEFQGETVWQGDVEVFDIRGHPKATRGYGWGYATGEEERAALLHCFGIAARYFATNGSSGCDYVGDKECKRKSQDP